MGQVLREEGPKSHAHKAKTPTAGGVSFIVSTVVGCAMFAAVILGYSREIAVEVLAVLFVGVACASLGLADDLAKVKQNSNKGLSPSIRLKIETLLGLVYSAYLIWHQGGSYKIWVPMMDAAQHLSLQPWAVPSLLAVPLITFLVVATSNSANMHDGMDGLATGTSFLIFCTLGTMALALSGADYMQLGIGAVSLCAASSMLGFFCFNRHPALLFMGDTGSLFIGGLMASITASGGLLLFFIPLLVIYILESVSVIVQTVVFKLTKPYTPDKPMSKFALIKLKLTKKLPGEGKRVFLMAPLHHHYEMLLAKSGWKEAQVVAAFWVAQGILCALVLGFFWMVR